MVEVVTFVQLVKAPGEGEGGARTDRISHA